MTEKEALEYIKTRLRYYIESTDDNIALSIAVKALEKQIPKMMCYEQDGYADGVPVYDFAECPNINCDKFFEEGDENWHCSYCPKCGQRLEWGEK